MARTVPEWIGKTDDTPPSAACKRRILERQGYVCAMTGLPFDAKNKPKFDHRIPLWLGGANRESNLQALRVAEAHAPKTAAEAKVRAKVNSSINTRFGIEPRVKQKIQSRPKAAKPPRDKLPIPPASMNPLYRRAS